MSKPRLWLLGASGFIGGRLEADLAARCDVRGDRVELRDVPALGRALARLRPDAVVNAAAMAAPDDCERQPEAARQVNALGPASLAAACAAARVPLFHFSTDLVFDGMRAPYREEDPVHPINVYGRTKREAEELVLDAHPGACVARVSLVYGGRGGRRPNFLETLLEELSAGRPMRLFTDQWRMPTPVASLPPVVEACLAGNVSGLYHWAGAERVNRLEFAQRVCAAFQLDRDLLRPATMADLPSMAPRPADCSLDSSRLSAKLGLAPWSIERGLADALAQRRKRL